MNAKPESIALASWKATFVVSYDKIHWRVMLRDSKIMNTDVEVQELSKSRFLETEASLWLLGNKSLEIALFVGIYIWFYFEFFSSGPLENIKFIGLIIIVLMISEIRSRLSVYRGYCDGYTLGFADAATRNCDYWGETHNQWTDSSDIHAALEEIKKNNEKANAENKESRESSIRKGFSNFIGFMLTWRKIR